MDHERQRREWPKRGNEGEERREWNVTENEKLFVYLEAVALEEARGKQGRE